MPRYDAIVVGGGLVGAAIAYGLAECGLTVAVLDEGDAALRASRGNFGLVWVQGKGAAMGDYAAWTRESAQLWPAFAAELRERRGIDVGYRNPGGIELCLGDDEFAARELTLRRMHNRPAPGANDARMIDRAEVRALLPGVGDAVVGGSFCPHDGHANSLYLLRALHGALVDGGAEYWPERQIARIERDGDGFRVEAGGEAFAAAKLVLAAGLGNRELAPQVGLHAPVRPERGQILVTERLLPFLPLPLSRVRQTEEGGVMIGDSHEDTGFDTGTSVDVAATLAARAVRMFPALAEAQVVRQWAALRVLSPDGCPIYEESASHPGAFVVTCHSGVTLAAAHARELAPAIARGEVNARFKAFSARRFDVPAH